MAITITHNNGAAAPTHAANGAGNQAGRDHVVVFPFMAKGHTLPLLHFTTALAVHQKNLRITVVITPANLAFARSRLPASVRLAVLPFPSLPPLPSGIESTDTLPGPDLYPTFLRARRSCGLRVVSAIARPLAGFRSSSPGGLLAGGLISTGTFLAGALFLHWLSQRWV